MGWFRTVLQIRAGSLARFAATSGRNRNKVNATERRIELPNGGLVEVWTLENGDAGRGQKIQGAIVDEGDGRQTQKLVGKKAYAYAYRYGG